MLKPKRIALTTVRQMGFTDKLINQLLPEPILVQNPYYKKAPPMKLWEEETVIKATKQQAFIDEQGKRARRKESAKKAVETKKHKLKTDMARRGESIAVKRLDLKTLKEKTIEAKQRHYNEYSYYDLFYEDASMADEETVNRWMVNYIRHNLTVYDDDLYEIRGKVGKNEAYILYFENVLNEIARVYPELKEECQEQIERKKPYYI